MRNSIQAVTGSDPISGTPVNTPNTTNPATHQWVFGTSFLGINHFWFESNEIYDSGTFNLVYSNIEDGHIISNWPHQPLPIVIYKNTDGIHGFGPDDQIEVSNNRVTSGDDAIAFNAEDGNNPATGDGASYYLSALPFRWGPDHTRKSRPQFFRRRVLWHPSFYVTSADR